MLRTRHCSDVSTDKNRGSEVHVQGRHDMGLLLSMIVTDILYYLNARHTVFQVNERNKPDELKVLYALFDKNNTEPYWVISLSLSLSLRAPHTRTAAGPDDIPCPQGMRRPVTGDLHRHFQPLFVPVCNPNMFQTDYDHSCL